MRPIASLGRDAVREVDRLAIERYGMTGLVLMENAGRGCAEAVDAILGKPAGWVVILCGGGNNGGDGYVIARHLQTLGHDVAIVQLVPTAKLSGDAMANAKIAEAADIPIIGFDPSSTGQVMQRAAAIVDCMLGTGASGPPREPYATAISLANEVTAVRIAVDVPSGLDCDTGVPHEPTFRAAHTLTFVAPKPGYSTPAAAGYVGQVRVIPIGVPRKLLEEL